MHTHNWQPRLIQLLTLPGLLIAYYLWLYHEGQIISACTVTNFFDCGRVSGPGATYATIGPIPVAIIGLLGYAAIFVVIWAADFLPVIEKHLPELLVGLIGFALLFTLYLKALEIFVIGVICQYCLYSAIIIAIMFALAIHYLIRGRRIEAA
ncbi:MAG: vitamin K epoxide reductase family protein [Chloroflexi bacterium]|nr:vitamin K epoxide reductase family protein [Chloroflexota bacterium]